MENYHNIKTHILYVCPACGAMKITFRVDFDLANSVFIELKCPKCVSLDWPFGPSLYFGKNGFLGDEEMNDGGN